MLWQCMQCLCACEWACMHTCMLLANPVLSLVSIFFFEVCFYIYISMWAYILVLPPTCVCVCTHTHTCLCVLHKLTWHSCMHIPGYMIVKNWPFVYFAGWIFIVCIISLPLSPKVVAFAFNFFFNHRIFLSHFVFQISCTFLPYFTIKCFVFVLE